MPPRLRASISTATIRTRALGSPCRRPTEDGSVVLAAPPPLPPSGPPLGAGHGRCPAPTPAAPAAALAQRAVNAHIGPPATVERRLVEADTRDWTLIRARAMTSQATIWRVVATGSRFLTRMHRRSAGDWGLAGGDRRVRWWSRCAPALTESCGRKAAAVDAVVDDGEVGARRRRKRRTTILTSAT